MSPNQPSPARPSTQASGIPVAQPVTSLPPGQNVPTAQPIPAGQIPVAAPLPMAQPVTTLRPGEVPVAEPVGPAGPTFKERVAALAAMAGLLARQCWQWLKGLPRSAKIAGLAVLGALVLVVVVVIAIRSFSGSENQQAAGQRFDSPPEDAPNSGKEEDPEGDKLLAPSKDDEPQPEPEPEPAPPQKTPTPVEPKPDPQGGTTRTRLRKAPELVLEIDMEPATKQGDMLGAPVDAVLSPDGRYLAVGGKFKVIRFFDAKTGKFLCRRPDPRPPMGSQRTIVWVDNRYAVASGSEHSAYAWDSQKDFRCVKAFRMSLYESLQLAWNPKRRLIAMAQAAGIINVWHFDTPAEGGEKGVMGFGDRTVRTEYAHALFAPTSGQKSIACQGVCFSPDGNRLAAVSKLGLDILDCSGKGPPLSPNAIHKKFFNKSVVPNVRDMPQIKRIPVPASDAAKEPHAYRVDWSSDGKYIAVGYGLRKDDSHKGAFAQTPVHIRLFDGTTYALVRDWKPHTVRVYGLEFSPDGSVLASGGHFDAYLWDPSTGTKLMSFPAHRDEVSSTRWSADGKFLVTTAGNERHDSPTDRNGRKGNYAFPGKDKKVRIWRVAD